MLCEFDYLNNKRDGFPDLKKTPSACQQGFSVLQIDTSSNNWFLSDDALTLGNVLQKHCDRYDTVFALCFSMGIMPALMFSKQLRLQKIMAFSPVVSIFGDDIVDNRFKTFQKYIQNPDIRNMWKDGNHDMQGVLCFDPTTHPIDRTQARLINDHYKRFQLIAMPFGGHPCMQMIKDAMGFKPIQDLVINDQFQAYNLRKLHRQSKEISSVYKKRIEHHVLLKSKAPKS